MNRLIGSAAVGAGAFLALAGAAAGDMCCITRKRGRLRTLSLSPKWPAPAKTAVKPAPK